MTGNVLLLEPLDHRSMACIAIRGRLLPASEELVRRFPNRAFTATHRCWYIPYTEMNLGELKRRLSEIQPVEIRGNFVLTNRVELPPLPEGYHEQLIRVRYSQATVRNYESQIRTFMAYLTQEGFEGFTDEAIRKYMVYLVEIRKVSVSTQNIVINAIKFYLERVKGGERKVYYVERPLKEQRLPRVLSEEEVARMVGSCRNVKHRCMLMLMYSAGLRLSEVLNLRLKDLDEGRMQVFVEGGKGRKDRVTLLSPKVLEFVKYYVSTFHPVHYLFEGPGKGRYSPRSVGMVVRKAAREAGIGKRVSPHTLRHSFATHLLEHGTDIRYIQELMGHGSSKTTERYTHVTTRGFSKIVSPFDRLDINFEGDSGLQ